MFRLAADGTLTAGPHQRNAWEFFYHNAGRSYRPDHESETVGTLRAALTLAAAERWSYSVGALYQWDDDPDGAEVQNEDGSWQTLPAVSCTVYVPCAMCRHGDDILSCERGLESHMGASLCGIAESDHHSERKAYRRVVEAELALETMPEVNV